MANRMRWKCDEHGCFNEKCRLKFEELETALPGKKSFTDVDALTEAYGNGLLIEWKDEPNPLGYAQSTTYGRLTLGRVLTAIVVAGNAETMTVTHMGYFLDGVWHNWKPATTDDLRRQISRWHDWAEANSRLTPVSK
jgi:hypothetical protein